MAESGKSVLDARTTKADLPYLGQRSVDTDPGAEYYRFIWPIQATFVIQAMTAPLPSWV